MKKKKFKILFYVLTILLALFFYGSIKVYAYSKQYSEAKSDVAIVLGAGTSNGNVSPVFRERLNHGKYLLDQNKVSSVIITGGVGEGQNVSDSKLGAKYLEKLGIESSKILIEEKSTITFYNICNANKIMINNQFNSALIISDKYHMKRAMSMCKRVGLNANPSPTPTSMYRSGKVKRKFFLNQTFQYWIYILFAQFRKANCA